MKLAAAFVWGRFSSLWAGFSAGPILGLGTPAGRQHEYLSHTRAETFISTRGMQIHRGSASNGARYQPITRLTYFRLIARLSR